MSYASAGPTVLFGWIDRFRQELNEDLVLDNKNVSMHSQKMRKQKILIQENLTSKA